MKRTVKATSRRLSIESLEARSLLNGSAGDELFVRFQVTDSAGDRAAELASSNASVVTTYPDGPELIRLGPGVVPAAAIRRLAADPGVVYAQTDATIHIESTPFYPNDPAFVQDWGLNQSNNIDIDAPEAYGVTLGSSSTVVAVIDTGVDLADPDLASHIWTNPVSDAAAGYPNDVHGWNFVADDNDVEDDNGHGTHVAAVIAAQGNNSYGIVGVAPSVQIMPLKFLDQNGNGSTNDAVSAIYYAVNHGARVINASWGGVEADSALADAIAYANAHNVVFVTAAGNDGTDSDYSPSYPGSYRESNELTVASIDQNGNLASFSDFGPASVDLAAPGVAIISEVPTSIEPNGLLSLSGTSMSTAYVSGVAALVAGVAPNLTAAQIVQRIDGTVKILPGLAGKVITSGMVDAYNAVTGTTPTLWTNPVPPSGILPLYTGLQTQTQVHATILASDEFFKAHGSSAVGFVSGLYVSSFGRLPDSAGLQSWVNVYNSGLATRFQMALAFMNLPEAKEFEVAKWYQVDLGRTATIDQLKADSGVDGWASLLSDGISDNAVRAAIMSTPEYLDAHGASPGPVVDGYYIDLTGRFADQGGQNFWASLLWQGEAPFNVVHTFLAQPEAAETMVSIWFLEDLGRPETLAQLKADPGIDALAADIIGA